MVDLNGLMKVREALAAFRQELAGTEERIEELLTQREQLGVDLDRVQLQQRQLTGQLDELREQDQQLQQQRDGVDDELARLEMLGQGLGLSSVSTRPSVDAGPTAPPSLGGRRRPQVVAQLTHKQLQELVLRHLPPTTESPLSTSQLHERLEPLGVPLDVQGKKRLQNMLRRMSQGGQVIIRKEEEGRQGLVYHRNSSDPVVEAAAFVQPAPPAPAGNGQVVTAALEELYGDLSPDEVTPEDR